MANRKLKEDFDQELSSLKKESLLDPSFRSKKLKIWIVRTILAIILYVVFWKVEWVRWTLWIYVPLNLLGLVFIYGGYYFLNKKVEATSQKVIEADAMLEDDSED